MAFLLLKRNEARGAFDELLRTVLRNDDAAAPAVLDLFVGGHRDRLPDENVAFMDDDVARLLAAILRCDERPVVAVAAPVHQRESLSAALLAEAVDRVDEFAEHDAGLQNLKARVEKVALHIDDALPRFRHRPEQKSLLLLRDQPAPERVGLVVNAKIRLEHTTERRVLEARQPHLIHRTGVKR